MEELFAGYPCKIVDDILVWGNGAAEHDANLHKVVQGAREVNIKSNVKKCKFRLDKVFYVGHQFIKDGVRPDDDKVVSIREMPVPDSTQALRGFLDMLNYLLKFIEDYREKTAALRGYQFIPY